MSERGSQRACERFWPPLTTMTVHNAPVRRRWARALSSAIVVFALAGCTSGGSPPRHGSPTEGDGTHATANLAPLLAGLAPSASRGPVYYLALGDSLSRGIQPGWAGADVPTSQGYPDQLAALLRQARRPGPAPGDRPPLAALQLVQLGCSGETTSTMIHGGICPYRAGSRLPAGAPRRGRTRHHRHRRQRPQLVRARRTPVHRLRLPTSPRAPDRGEPQRDLGQAPGRG